MKIRSDHFKEHEKEREESDARFEKMTGVKPLHTGSDCEPADLYGKRVNLDMEDEENLEKTADDIQDVYGLEPSVIEPDNGGLAKEDDDGDY